MIDYMGSLMRYNMLNAEKCAYDSLIGKNYQQLRDYFDVDLRVPEIKSLHKSGVFNSNLTLDIDQILDEIKKLEAEKQIILYKMTKEKRFMEGE